jgi:hypothetical protein
LNIEDLRIERIDGLKWAGQGGCRRLWGYSLLGRRRASIRTRIEWLVDFGLRYRSDRRRMGLRSGLIIRD